MLAEIVLVGALSGFVQGLSGFAFGLVATSLWAWMMKPQDVVVLVVLGSVIGQFTSFMSVRKHVEVRLVAPFLLGGLVGVPAGVTVLHSLDAPVFRAIVGVGLVVFCTVMLAAPRLPSVRAGAWADGLVGLISGVLGGASGLAGPPMIIWCAMRGWEMRTQRATYQSFFIVVQCLILTFMIWKGTISSDLVATFVWLAPAVVLSSWLGARIAKRYDQKAFKQIVFALLLAAGIALIIPAAFPIRPALTGESEHSFAGSH